MLFYRMLFPGLFFLYIRVIHCTRGGEKMISPSHEHFPVQPQDKIKTFQGGRGGVAGGRVGVEIGDGLFLSPENL